MKNVFLRSTLTAIREFYGKHTQTAENTGFLMLGFLQILIKGEDYGKKISLEDGNIIKINNYGRGIIIAKGYLKNDEPSKVLTTSMTDNFGFEAFTFSDEETDSVDFSIPQYNPLYKLLYWLVFIMALKMLQ